METIPYSEAIDIKAVTFYLKFFNIIGIYKKPNNSRIYDIWPYCLHFTFTALYLTSMLVNITLNLKIEDLYITLTEVAMFCKMISIFRQQNKIKALLNYIRTEKVFYLKNESEKKMVYGNLRRIEKNLIVYRYVSLTALVMAALQALFR